MNSHFVKRYKLAHEVPHDLRIAMGTKSFYVGSFKGWLSWYQAYGQYYLINANTRQVYVRTK